MALLLCSIFKTFAYSPLCFLYISCGADEKNLFNNQELLQLVIISFIPIAKILIQGDTIKRNQMLFTLRHQRVNRDCCQLPISFTRWTLVGLFSKVVPILACSRNAVTETKMKKQVKLKGTNTKLGKDWSEPQILPFFLPPQHQHYHQCFLAETHNRENIKNNTRWTLKIWLAIPHMLAKGQRNVETMQTLLKYMEELVWNAS